MSTINKKYFLKSWCNTEKVRKLNGNIIGAKWGINQDTIKQETLLINNIMVCFCRPTRNCTVSQSIFCFKNQKPSIQSRSSI